MTNEAGVLDTALVVPPCNGGAEDIPAGKIIRQILEATLKGEAKTVP